MQHQHSQNRTTPRKVTTGRILLGLSFPEASLQRDAGPSPSENHLQLPCQLPGHTFNPSEDPSSRSVEDVRHQPVDAQPNTAQRDCADQGLQDAEDPPARHADMPTVGSSQQPSDAMQQDGQGSMPAAALQAHQSAALCTPLPGRTHQLYLQTCSALYSRPASCGSNLKPRARICSLAEQGLAASSCKDSSSTAPDRDPTILMIARSSRKVRQLTVCPTAKLRLAKQCQHHASTGTPITAVWPDSGMSTDGKLLPS